MPWIIACLVITGCGASCYYNRYQDVTDYTVGPGITLSNDIRIDDPNGEMNIDELNRQTDAFEECSGLTVRRECLTVKVAPDWYVSPCSGQQMFPCEIPDSVCEEKDLPISEECPCACRAMIQDENTIIVTPNLYLYRAELARMVTGINNPWESEYVDCLLDHEAQSGT